MTEPERYLTGAPLSPVDGIDFGKTRVRSEDYGPGTVVAEVGIGIQILWDRPMLEGGVGPQLLVHDRAYVERLRVIEACPDCGLTDDHKGGCPQTGEAPQPGAPG